MWNVSTWWGRKTIGKNFIKFFLPLLPKADGASRVLWRKVYPFAKILCAFLSLALIAYTANGQVNATVIGRTLQRKLSISMLSTVSGEQILPQTCTLEHK